jgi:hypothetical protein
VNDLSPIGDHLDDDYLQLPRAALAEVGQAAQTLGALYWRSRESRETFYRRELLAETARLSLSSLDRHLEKLVEWKWIINRGRKRFSKHTHKVRRSNTIMLTSKADSQRSPYLKLLLWTCEFLPLWADRVVFAAIVSRHQMLEVLAIELDHGREGYSVRSLARDCGLHVETVIAAKTRLADRGFILIDATEPSRRGSGQIISFPDDIHVNVDLELPIPQPPEPCSDSDDSGKGKRRVDRVRIPVQTRSDSDDSGVRIPTRGCSDSDDRNDRALKTNISISIENKHADAPLEGGRRFVSTETPEKLCTIKKVQITEEREAERRKLVSNQIATLLAEEANTNGSCP